MDDSELSKSTITLSPSLVGVDGVILVHRDSSDAFSSDHSCASKITISQLLQQLSDEQPSQSPPKKSIASWKRSEIERLGSLILEYGTDFSAISLLMGKSRDQVKRKFKVMQKKDASFGFQARD